MSVRVYRVPDEPIIIATFQNVVTSELMQQMYTASDALLPQTMPHPFYRITDFRTVHTTPAEVMRIFRAARMDIPGSTTDPRLRPILLGDNRWTRMAIEMMWQAEGMELPVFENLRDALMHINILLYRRGQSQAGV